jgi:glyoxylase-like metal-dependent hydrolase (beta-lactamase superfamily II)/rhodanese-related sulfurtransferase
MKEISHEELTHRLSAGEKISVLDIRERDEYDDWHIFGAVNIPIYNAIGMGDYAVAEERLKTASLDAGKPVVAVCRTGQTSLVAARALESMGFEAASLNGGMRGWSNSWTAVPIAVDGGTLIQIRRNGKGCLSYIVGAQGEAAVIDPCVEVEVYTAVAESNGLKITHVLETHVHADHVSRAQALCTATGAGLYLPKNDRVKFDYHELNDGDSVTVGGMTLGVVATPGHTGESVCYDIGGKALLSGDTVFADNIGRPDLEKGDTGAAAGAGMLFDSLHNRILPMADHVLICPGHTSDSIGFDDTPIGAPLGEIKSKVSILGLGKDEFIKKVTASLGAKPPNFERVIAVNEGRADLGWLDPLELEAGPNRCAVKG